MLTTVQADLVKAIQLNKGKMGIIFHISGQSLKLIGLCRKLHLQEN